MPPLPKTIKAEGALVRKTKWRVYEPLQWLRRTGTSNEAEILVKRIDQQRSI
jgi:hypothetical protein